MTCVERVKIRGRGLGALEAVIWFVAEAFMQFVAHKAPNQQGNEGANLRVVELGRHPAEAFVHLAWVEPTGEFLVDAVSDIL
jgi:hypothetical protein